MDIKLSKAAILENCAEECAELSHACLKMARKIRGENPTPKTIEEIKENLIEELADVALTMSALISALDLNMAEIENLVGYKTTRWKHRLEKAGK